MNQVESVDRRAGLQEVVAAGLFALAAMVLPASAQSVAMTGSMGSKALLVVDGSAPKALAAGETHRGVKVVAVRADQVTVEVGGKRQNIDLGGAPVSIGGAGGGGGGTQIVLTATSGGHFVTSGSINGRATQFMVDTGATSVAIGADEARRMGINYEQGDAPDRDHAIGRAAVPALTLKSLRIQDVEVYGVDAVVVPAGMPHVLLGNSFLTRFQMKRENDMLTLTRRF